jgi:hypothetical protein
MSIVTLEKNKHLSVEIRTYLPEAISEFLSDADFGLELSEKAKRRLRYALTSKQKNIFS